MRSLAILCLCVFAVLAAGSSTAMSQQVSSPAKAKAVKVVEYSDNLDLAYTDIAEFLSLDDEHEFDADKHLPQSLERLLVERIGSSYELEPESTVGGVVQTEQTDVHVVQDTRGVSLFRQREISHGYSDDCDGSVASYLVWTLILKSGHSKILWHSKPYRGYLGCSEYRPGSEYLTHTDVQDIDLDGYAESIHGVYRPLKHYRMYVTHRDGSRTIAEVADRSLLLGNYETGSCYWKKKDARICVGHRALLKKRKAFAPLRAADITIYQGNTKGKTIASFKGDKIKGKGTKAAYARHLVKQMELETLRLAKD